MAVQQLPHVGLELYVKEVLIPVFGVRRCRYRYEFAKSSGHTRFHMFDICAEKHPRMLLHEMRNGGRMIRKTPSLLGIGGDVAHRDPPAYRGRGA